MKKENIMFIIGLLMVLISVLAMFITESNGWIAFGICGIVFIGVSRRKTKKS